MHAHTHTHTHTHITHTHTHTLCCCEYNHVTLWESHPSLYRIKCHSVAWGAMSVFWSAKVYLCDCSPIDCDIWRLYTCTVHAAVGCFLKLFSLRAVIHLSSTCMTCYMTNIELCICKFQDHIRLPVLTQGYARAQYIWESMSVYNSMFTHSLVNQSEKDFNGGRTKNDLSPPMLYFSTPNLVSVQLIRSFSVLRFFLGWRLVTCIFVCVCWGQSASIHAVCFRI